MSTRACLPHVVYRCYDAQDRLLYIGHTYRTNTRFHTHRSSTKPASIALCLAMVRHTEVEHPTKAEAAEAERRAIWTEAPLLNTHHQRFGTANQRRAFIRAYIDELMGAAEDAELLRAS
jgi:predicted GIY-YIG superfamily endonuclease